MTKSATRKLSFVARSAKGDIRNVSVRPRLGQQAFRAVFADAKQVGRLLDKSDPSSLVAVVQRSNADD